MVMYCGLIKALIRPQCIVCCNCSCAVGCASPLPNHCVEKARSTERKIVLLAKGEKKRLKGVGYVFVWITLLSGGGDKWEVE